MEKELMHCITLRWKPKFHYDVNIDLKGFFTLIFTHQDDIKSIMDCGPYPSKHHILCINIQYDIPTIPIIQETKFSITEFSSIISKIWNSAKNLTVEAEGASDSLGIAWNPSQIDMEPLSLNPIVLTSSFHLLGTDFHGFLSNVYGPQSPTKKQVMLDNISSLKSQLDPTKWVSGGDLNIITSI